ncbi:MAG: penicillin-binding protein 1A [Thalassolituus sp.]|uniref:penicillin-binding protein 1A n=1 Tax=Thalassolituus sp. TaxID=2030822 RepID=UPI0027D5008F|nr:penicillin-binding protein 1A [Thalassolituus sp.]MDQ4424769.1 penicillin-binding protein 1A [Thalassolituus sp.]MDQ4425314.1 penicillin-binding protein 1A [Thalassolituus sp.]
MAITGVYLYLAPTLPDAETLKDVDLQTPLRVYTADGLLITEYGEKRRTPITYQEIPPQFIDALLASEDDGFFEHSGIDLKGLARAVFDLVTTGRKKSGGSTITMQVAKNYYLSSEKTFTRKFTEILLALKIEKALTKEEILELYVNKIYLGKRAYGIEAASQVYYGKSITELNLAELAMIAGLPQAPSAANPIRSPERAVSRRNYVLARMYNLGKISEAEFQQSIRQPATARYHGATSEISAPYVAEMIRLEMIRRYGNKAYTSGYSVYTTINAKRQQAANAALQKGLLKYDRDHGYRGAQATYSVIPLSVPEPPELEEWITQADPTKDVDWPQTLNNWEEQLRELGDFGIIEPAVVMNAIEEGAWVYSVGQIRWLPFEGMTWAAPYLSVNSVGEAPENALDVVSDGDLIWLEATSSGLKLAQVPEAEGALVSMNPHNGAIEALVGGFSNSDNQFNRATQAERQPGSAFKPFIYSAALDNGFTTASLINDAPVVFKDASLESTWRPENYSGKFYGPTRLRQALYRSQNLVSIRILKQMGPATAVRYIQDFGFNPARLNKDLSLALGASAVTPLDMATGYSAFANGGYKVSPFVMQSIISDTGEILYEANPALAMAPPEEDSTGNFISEGVNDNNAPVENNSEQAENIEEPTLFAERIMSPENHYLTVSMMRDVVRRGTGRKALALGRNDLAGKTGTTNDQKDAWFSGFNPDLVATVWIGFDQPTTLGRWASGGGTALPVWVDYMREALDGAPEEQFEQPEGIVTVRIDPDSGLLASPGQKDAIFEYFKTGSAPTEYARTKDIIPYQEDETGSRGGSVIPEQLF